MGWTEQNALVYALTLQLIAVCLWPSYSTSLGLVFNLSDVLSIILYLATVIDWEEYPL